MATELGVAYVSIVPSTKDLAPGIRKAVKGVGTQTIPVEPKIRTDAFLRDAKGRFSRAGQQAGQDFTTGFKSTGERLGHQVGAAIGTVIGRGIGGPINAGRWLDTKAFHAIGRSLGNILSTGMMVGVAGVGATVAAVLYGGFQRIKTMDTAKVVLKAMGLDPAAVQQVMKDVEGVVKGTPISLPDAFGAAAGFIASGVKQGPELIRILTDAADVAGAFAAPFASVVDIFTQIQANSGIVTGEIEERFRYLNIPIKSWVMETKGITAEMYDDLRRNNQITLADLEATIEQHAPGMAKALGDTIEGATQNVMAAASRLGQNMLVALFGGNMADASASLVDGLKGITDQFDKISAWVRDHVPEITRAVGDIGAAFMNTVTGIMEVYRWILVVDEAWLRFRSKVAVSGADKEELRAEADAQKKRLDDVDALIKKNKESTAEWQRNRETAAQVAQATEDLGSAVTKLQRDTGGYILKAPTVEDLNAIDEAKYRVDQIPGTKDFRIIPKTVEATTAVDTWLAEQEKKKAEVPVDANTQPAAETTGRWRLDEQGNIVAVPVDADTTPAQTTLDEWTSLIMGKPLQIPVQIQGSGPTGNPILDFIPSAGDSGGVLKPNAQATKSYYESQGFNVGGYSPADSPEDEHQTGEAIDVMVPSLPAGYGLLPNALRRPGVQYVIWDNKMWYPDGTSQPYNGPSPHTDHLHIRQKASGGSVHGPGTGTSDSIPAWLSSGEHVLTAADVAALGGQGGVYAFRDALHRAGGGGLRSAKPTDEWSWQPKPWRDWGTPGARGKVDPNRPQPLEPVWPNDPSPGLLPKPGHKYEPSGPTGEFVEPPPWWAFPGPGQRWPQRSAERRHRRGIFGFAQGGAVGPKIPGYGLKWVEGKGWVESGEPGIPLGPPEHQGTGDLPGPPAPPIEHKGTGAPPGPPQPAALAERTQGYIPAAAGSTSVAGKSAISGFIGMGAEVINGLIDQAASAAASAAGIAMAGGTMGAGAPAAPAVSGATAAAIGLGTQAAKRGVTYGFDLASIWTDALLEQATPFGMPRWLTEDYTGFMPQWQPQLEALTQPLIEQALGATPAALTAEHGAAQGAPPGPAVAPPPLDFITPATAQPEVQPPANPPLVNIENVQTASVDEFGRELSRQQRLAMMQYSGRP